MHSCTTVAGPASADGAYQELYPAFLPLCFLSDYIMNPTKWIPKKTSPVHWGVYEIRTRDDVVSKAAFSDEQWLPNLPFEKWRGIDCSLKKREIKELVNTIYPSEKLKSDKGKREAFAALKIARHYFSLSLPNDSKGKSKTFKAMACKCYRIASEYITLDSVDARAFEMAANDLSIGDRNRYVDEVVSTSGDISAYVPDEL